MLNIALNKIQTALGFQPTNQDSEWANTSIAILETITLTEATHKLEKYNFLDQENLRKNIDILLNLDQDHYKITKKTTNKYLIDINKKKAIENDAEVALYEYCRALYNAYIQVVEVYGNQSELKFDLKHVNLILARTLNAAFLMAKYRYFDDQPAPIGTWENVSKIIKIAEKLTLMNKTLFLYKFQIKETSIATILKRGFMLSTLQKGSFSKLEIEVTDRILKIWESNPLIVRTYKQGRYHFAIKLGSDSAPDRVRMVEKFIEYRFWRTTRLLDLMESYLCDVDTHKGLKGYGLEKVAPVSVVVKLLKKLRVEWCVEGYSRQRRKEKRNKERKLLELSYGVEGICQRLAAQQAKSLKNKMRTKNADFKVNLPNQEKAFVSLALTDTKVAGTDSYWTVDESKNGFAIDFGFELEDWVDTGVLVGYDTAEEESRFGIAEIRSVRKLASGIYRAGFRIISKSVKAIDVLTAANAQGVSGYLVDDEDAFSHGKVRKYLGMFVFDEEKDAVPMLVIPRAEYQKDKKYTININAVDRKLVPGKIVSKQRDWVCFEVLF